MKRVGIHLRLINQTLTELIEQAVRLQVPFFQFFLVRQTTSKLTTLDDVDVQQFLQLRRRHFSNVYLHGSYWINLAGAKEDRVAILERELELAQRLELTHIVIHPGSVKRIEDRPEGVDSLARALNYLFKKDQNIRVLLENAAHGKRCIGGDLLDFKNLLEKLDQPEKLSFCIDTSHAHSFGYNIISEREQELFIQLLDKTIGIDKIALIHLNDTKERCGANIDRHHSVGHGVIGEAALKHFITHPRLQHIPVIMEPPLLTEDEQLNIVHKVASWHQASM